MMGSGSFLARLPENLRGSGQNKSPLPVVHAERTRVRSYRVATPEDGESRRGTISPSDFNSEHVFPFGIPISDGARPEPLSNVGYPAPNFPRRPGLPDP